MRNPGYQLGIRESCTITRYPYTITWISATVYGADERYVLWPRGDLWDVRYYNRHTNEMLPIADAPFSDESAAWLAAFSHWEALSKKSQFIYEQNDDGSDGMFKRIPVIGN